MLYFEQSTEVEWVNTCSISVSASIPPPLTFSKSTVISTPTFPLFFLFSVPGAHTKKIKILTFLSLLIYSWHELFANATASRKDRCRTSDTVGFVRPRSFRRFLRCQNSCFSAEQSPAFQSAQTSDLSRSFGAASHEKRRAVQLEKLPRGRGCFDGVLQADPGGNRR